MQKLSKVIVGNNSNAKGQKEVSLTSSDGKKCKKKSDKKEGSDDEKTKKTCNHCGKSGHLEKNCWQKNPDKAPKWANDRPQRRTANLRLLMQSSCCATSN